MNPIEVVSAVRSQYPTPMTVEQCVRVCNEVAWLLNGRSASGPWGLRAKTTGEQWGGYCKDVVVDKRDGQLRDILVAAPDVAAPAWQDVGKDATLWAPVRLDLLPASTPVPPTPEPPTPPTIPDDLVARVAALEGRVAALEARFRQAGQIMAGV